MAKRNNWRLTKFELYLNLGLTLVVIYAMATFGTRFHSQIPGWILFFFFARFAIPLDVFPAITIYSRKFLNLLWHSAIALIIYKNKNHFAVKNVNFDYALLIFAYFNVMRFVGELIIGKDPVWLTKWSSSDAKKRAVTSADRNWTLTYFILGGIIILIILNPKIFS